ncbi:MAG: peptidoglycan DD-metalloendopeptidase family protein [Balneolaceae bacterium]
MNYRYAIILLFLVPILPSGLFAQSSYEDRRSEVIDKQSSTRSQIQNLEEQIQSYNERLGETTEQYEQIYEQYEQLRRLITLQEEKIRQMEQEQAQISEEITIVEANLNELETQLTSLIEEYKSTLTYLYKNGRTTELALILTSTSVNQLLVRSYYLSRFDQHRQAQANEIELAQQELEESKEDLQTTRERNREALASIEEEKQDLEQQENLQSRNVELLKQDQENLRDQVAAHQSQLDELDSALDDLMAEEEQIEEAERERQRLLAEAGNIEDDDERRAAEERYSTPVLRESGVSDEELSAFEDEFAAAKGNLSWPVENGTITEKFGVRIHPVLGTRTNNPGVDIAAAPQSTVRVVNDGYVYEVMPFRDLGEVVLVNHGNYKTAYGNLSSIFVQKNQVLETGDVLGLSGDENSTRGEVLFFLIREGSQNVNPENWLQQAVP